MIEAPYDRTAAVRYAKKWALGRNPAYYDFEEIGGDCTNFASQCIYAGSGIMNYTPVYGWFYRSSYDRTASWTGVEYLYNFLTRNESVGPCGKETDISGILPGDIVQLGNAEGRFYHSPVITSLYPTVLVAAHSDDALNRPLFSYEYYTLRFIHITGVRKQ